MLGVGGIPIFGMVLLAGVLIMSPMLASFRRGGVGGFTKDGEDGSDDCLGS